jgi:hypothetical protein
MKSENGSDSCVKGHQTDAKPVTKCCVRNIRAVHNSGFGQNEGFAKKQEQRRYQPPYHTLWESVDA